MTYIIGAVILVALAEIAFRLDMHLVRRRAVRNVMDNHQEIMTRLGINIAYPVGLCTASRRGIFSGVDLDVSGYQGMPLPESIPLDATIESATWNIRNVPASEIKPRLTIEYTKPNDDAWEDFLPTRTVEVTPGVRSIEDYEPPTESPYAIPAPEWMRKKVDA